jgi:thiamine-phosphate pyrophosphorylase
MISYLITDPKYYSTNRETFSQILERNIQKNNPDFICFRDKTSVNTDELIKAFLEICNKYNKKSFINSYINNCINYNSNGIHITSTQIDKVKEYQKYNKITILSTHNEDDIKIAIDNNIDYITYSPIFKTPQKGTPKGINSLKNIKNKYDIPIIALGGIISNKQVTELKNIKAFGFASIRYFI